MVFIEVTMNTTYFGFMEGIEDRQRKSSLPFRFAFLVCLLLLCSALRGVAADGDFSYTPNGDGVTITSYLGPGGAVTIPDTIDGKPVTGIGDLAFGNNTAVSSIIVPDSVTRIGIYAFTGCTSLVNVIVGNGVTSMGNYLFTGCSNLKNITIGPGLTSIGLLAFGDCATLRSIYFEGNAPGLGDLAFQGSNLVTIYRLPDATGWVGTFGSRPTVIWDPVIDTQDPRFGFDEAEFGFSIVSVNALTVDIQVSDDLESSNWTDLGTVTLTDGIFDFSDPGSAEAMVRFYRLRMPRGE